MHFAVRALVIAGATALLASLALAADPKPDAAIKTRAVEANVFLDSGLGAYPALAADCLAEGRKWIDKNASEAASELKQDPQSFRDGGFAFERKYRVRSVIDDRYISVVRDDYMDTRGAHPNTDVNTILWDRSARKRISIRPFFTETADGGPTMEAMRKAIIAALRVEKKKRDSSETATAEWFKGIEPKLTGIGAVALAPSTESGRSSGLIFYFPPYAVGPYVEGPYTAFVPWDVLKTHLSPEGARIFGGGRPRSDDDDAR